VISSVSGTSGGSSAASTAPSTVAPARGSTSGAPSTSSGPPTKQAPTQQAQEDEESDESEYDSEDEDATLDNVSEIKRKTIAIRGENLQATLMDNIESITASVAQFKKQEKDNPQNDVIALYNNEKENYEQEIEKLTKRLVKQ